MTDSNANTSGLEVSLSAVLARAICESEGKEWAALDNTREDVERWFRLGEVTAASAQARIAELEALVASIRRAQRDVIRAEIEQEGYAPISDANDRATAAEARADRLAKALEAVISYAPDIRPARIARAALQQETQK